jgi:hypothetical protein
MLNEAGFFFKDARLHILMRKCEYYKWCSRLNLFYPVVLKWLVIHLFILMFLFFQIYKHIFCLYCAQSEVCIPLQMARS